MGGWVSRPWCRSRTEKPGCCWPPVRLGGPMAPTTPNINAPAKLGNPGASNLSSPAVGEIHFACAATTAWGRHSLAALARSSSASLGERRALPVPIGPSAGDVPQQDRRIAAAADQAQAIGRERHAADIAPVALETPDQPASRRLPQMQRTVHSSPAGRSRRYQLAVGGEGDHSAGAAMPLVPA